MMVPRMVQGRCLPKKRSGMTVILPCRPPLLGVVFAGLLMPSRGLARRGMATLPLFTAPPSTLTGQPAPPPRVSRGSGDAAPCLTSTKRSTLIWSGSDESDQDPDRSSASDGDRGSKATYRGTYFKEESSTGVANREARTKDGKKGQERRTPTEGPKAASERRMPEVPFMGGRRRSRGARRLSDGSYDNGDTSDIAEESMSPAMERWETRNMEVALALAAAKRGMGRGERGRLTESDAPVEEFLVRGRRVLVKRDDKMRLSGSGLSGNKARKLYALNKIPEESFPKLVASHGGIQSNAMVAIAAVVAGKRGSSFVYYTKPVPRWLRKNPVGNFARALALGAEITEVHPEDYKRVFGGADGPGAGFAEVVPKEALFIPQGGADTGAEEGVSMLAEEIADYWDANGPAGKDLRVVLPAGTGTTALFLARHLVPAGITVYAVPCAGDGSYLLRQMKKVDRASGSVGIFPEIMEAEEKAAFGVPRAELLDVWRELDGLGLLVDLVYASPVWEVMFKAWEKAESPLTLSPGMSEVDIIISSKSEPQIMYVHCGGLEGISSQLTRYKHQGLVEVHHLQ